MTPFQQVTVQLRAALAGATRRRAEYILDCPMCITRIGKADEEGHLGINLSKGVFNCFRCHWGGKVEWLLAGLARGGITLDTEPALGRLDLSQVLRTVDAKPQVELAAAKLPAGFVELGAAGSGWMAQRARDYLTRRGCTAEDLLRLRPGITVEPSRPGEPNCRGRVILPVVVDGATVFWVARTLGTAEPKTFNPRLGDEEVKPLWGLDDLEPGGHAVLMEGIFSALAHPCGIATFGSKLTQHQLWLLATKAPRQITFLFDSDAAGREGAAVGCELVRQNYDCELRIAQLPGPQDPGDYLTDRQSILELVARAPRYTPVHLAASVPVLHVR